MFRFAGRAETIAGGKQKSAPLNETLLKIWCARKEGIIPFKTSL